MQPSEKEQTEKKEQTDAEGALRLPLNREAILSQYENPRWNPSNGREPEEVCAGVEKILVDYASLSRREIKGKLLKYVLSTAQVAVCPDCLFADAIRSEGLIMKIRERWRRDSARGVLAGIIAENENARKTVAYHAGADFGHIAPDWERVLRLGIPGLIRELREAARSAEEAAKPFYSSSLDAMEGFLSYVTRLAETAETCREGLSLRTASNLRGLLAHAPQTLEEAIQLIILVYRVMEHVEGENCRSLGRMDVNLVPFYRDGEEGRWILDQMMLKIFSFGNINNTPFCIGGTDREGKDVTGLLSYRIVEEFEKLDIPDPKIHVRIGEKTPKAFLTAVLSSIRAGKSSFVFVNDDAVLGAYRRLGVPTSEARDYLLIGCYEPQICGQEAPCTCSGKLNFEKGVEAVLNDGCDFLTGLRFGPSCGREYKDFDSLFAAYLAQLDFYIDRSVEKISATERDYMNQNPSPFLSSTFADCVRDGRDVYEGGLRYNNSSISGFGLATAVDSLLAIRELVFREKKLSLPALTEILKKNWEGEESLRLTCLKKLPKYGNNDPDADGLAKEIAEHAAARVIGRKNGRGGLFRFALFSVDWRIWAGKVCGATPDGRFAGEPLSKNLSASIGCDGSGVSALIASATRIPGDLTADGAVLDVVLHESAVSGEEGLSAFLALLETWREKGGMAVHFNVLSPEKLKEAQREPEKYKTLQIRLCGWNVYFVNLSRAEQDEFILNAGRGRI